MHWFQTACQKMVREDKSLFIAACELNLGMTKKDCDDLLKDLEFQRVLRGERLRYYRELATDPGRSKQSNIGTLLYLADRLIAKGMDDKAANVIMSIMKAEGQLEDKSTINVFGDLTAKDLAAARDKITKKAAELAN